MLEARVEESSRQGASVRFNENENIRWKRIY